MSTGVIDLSALTVKHNQLLVETACKIVESVAYSRCFSYNDANTSPHEGSSALSGGGGDKSGSASRFALLAPPLYSLRSSLISCIGRGPVTCHVALRLSGSKDNKDQDSQWLLLERWVVDMESYATQKSSGTQVINHTEHSFLREVYQSCAILTRAALAAAAALPATVAIHQFGMVDVCDSSSEATAEDDWLLTESTTALPASHSASQVMTSSGTIAINKLLSDGRKCTVCVGVTDASTSSDAAFLNKLAFYPKEKVNEERAEVDLTAIPTILKMKERAFAGVRSSLGRLRISVQYREDALDAIRDIKDATSDSSTLDNRTDIRDATSDNIILDNRTSSSIRVGGAEAPSPPNKPQSSATMTLRYTPYVGAVPTNAQFVSDFSLNSDVSAPQDVTSAAVKPPPQTNAKHENTVLQFLSKDNKNIAMHRDSKQYVPLSPSAQSAASSYAMSDIAWSELESKQRLLRNSSKLPTRSFDIPASMSAWVAEMTAEKEER